MFTWVYITFQFTQNFVVVIFFFFSSPIVLLTDLQRLNFMFSKVFQMISSHYYVYPPQLYAIYRYKTHLVRIILCAQNIVHSRTLTYAHTRALAICVIDFLLKCLQLNRLKEFIWDLRVLPRAQYLWITALNGIRLCTYLYF